MSEYISREEVLKAVTRLETTRNGYDFTAPQIKSKLASIKAADVIPVVHARWLDIEEYGWSKTVCSNCHGYAPKDPLGWRNLKSRFCHLCGAKMDGESSE